MAMKLLPFSASEPNDESSIPVILPGHFNPTDLGNAKRGHRGVADAPGGTAEPQAGGLVQGLPLPSRELEDGTACGGEGEVPLRGVVPPSWIHRDQPGNPEPGGSAVLQQARDGRAVDQGGQAGRKDDPPLVSPFSLKPSAAGAEPAGLQSGNLWRRLALPKRIENWSLTSLQQRLVKTGGRLVKHARYYWLFLAESHLTRRLFGSMVRRIVVLSLPAG
jgi:hypothetical protein